MAKKQYFSSEQFTSTKFDTAEEKAKFANYLADFLLAGCPNNKFTRWLYDHLMLHFNGHIAHYDQAGFYRAQFSTAERREGFIRRMLEYSCYGQPEHTFCDVERAMQVWYREHKQEVEEGLLARMQVEEDADKAERARRAVAQGAQTQRFKVVAKSGQPGSFGHWQYIVVAEDGSTYELHRSGSYTQHVLDDVLAVSLHDGRPMWHEAGYELAYRKGNPSKDLLAKVWADPSGQEVVPSQEIA